MELVLKINNKDILIDATTNDPNNSSNRFVLGADLSSSYFPGAAAVSKTRSKTRKYKTLYLRPKNRYYPSSLKLRVVEAFIQEKY